MQTTIDQFTGTILRVKGHFGFIGVAGFGDAYFRVADLQGLDADVPLLGRRVTCELRKSLKGFEAINIRPA